MEIIIVVLVFLVAYVLTYSIGMASLGREKKSVVDYQGISLVDQTVQETYENVLANISGAILIINKDMTLDHLLGANALELVGDFDFFIFNYTSSGSNGSSISAVLKQLFVAEKPEEIERLIKLLPVEVRIYDRVLNVHNRFSRSKKQLTIYLTDYTNLSDQSDAFENISNNQKMIINYLKNPSVFKDSLHRIDIEISAFMEDAFNICETTKDYKERVISGVRSVAIIAESLELCATTKKLTEIYNKISEFPSGGSIESIKHLYSASDFLNITVPDRDVLAEFMEVNKNMEEKVCISSKIIRELETTVTSMENSSDKSDLINSVFKIKTAEISEIVDGFSNNAIQMANQYRKKLNPISLIIEDPGFEVDIIKPRVYTIASLLNNAVTHGIENPEVRFRSGKSEFGTISVKISLEKDSLAIVISDDGAGLKPEIIKLISDDYKSDFRNVISGTIKKNASPHSSMLGLVNSKVGREGGYIKFRTKKGSFTEFSVVWPSN